MGNICDCCIFRKVKQVNEYKAAIIAPPVEAVRRSHEFFEHSDGDTISAKHESNISEIDLPLIKIQDEVERKESKLNKADSMPQQH